MEKKGRRVRSMRGTIVDFDLMEIHAQLASQPKTTDVTAREEFIESRLNRRLKRRIENQKKLEEELLKKKEAEQEVVEVVEEPQPKPRVAIKEIKEEEPHKEPEIINPLPVVEEEAPRARTIKKKKIEE